MSAKFDFDAPDCTCEYRHGIVARNMVGHTPPCPVYERWQATHGQAYKPKAEREHDARCVDHTTCDGMIDARDCVIRQQAKEIANLRAALLPFAAAAGRPGRLLDCMTDSPLPDDAVLGLGVKVSAWKRSIELTGA